jgi:glycosyltransferase involved in cell wall biosynthesis
LYRWSELALGIEVIVLSSHPPATDRGVGRWLPAVESRFSSHRQLFCPVWDIPKFRIPFTWISYAFHVFRHTRRGDVILMDNFEWLYVFAAWPVRLLRSVQVVLDFEDGKHLIDRSWSRVLSALAEFAGRPLVRAALLAHPALGSRLPATVPTEVVPGFVVPTDRPEPFNEPEVRLLYSGTLDRARGVDLLMEALEHMPDRGWHLDICGSGPMEGEVSRRASDEQMAGKVEFHRSLKPEDYYRLLRSCHVGLNCQRAGDPVSGVTFPSKVFTYLSAGLVVLSSRASSVEQVCGDACMYYGTETGEALAEEIRKLIETYRVPSARKAVDVVAMTYSLEGTAARVKALFERAFPIK